MPLLLVFALIAACLPIDWPEPPPLGPRRETALALSGGAVAFVLLLAFGLRTWVVRTLRRDPDRRVEVGWVYGRVRRLLFFVNVATAAACVLGFGWGWLVQHELTVDWTVEPGSALADTPVLAPFAELAVLVPYFIVLVSCWIIYYDAERALSRALSGAGRPFSPRYAYLLHNARQFALMVMLPVGLVVTQQTLVRFVPELLRTDAYRIASLAALPVLLLFMPLAMKPLLGLTTMPAGPLRTRFEALAKRLHFRCTDFLLWSTHGSAANALIAGLLPRIRYVVFTDRILEELPPDELEAVFGHEVGHARHGHIWLYAGFLTLSMTVLGGVLMFGQQQIYGRVKLTDQSLEALRTQNLPDAVLWKLDTLKDQDLRRMDFERELAKVLSADELDKFLKPIVSAGQLDQPPSDEWVQFGEQLEELKTWLLLLPVALVAAYLFVVWGSLSRRCERQADVFGCRAVSCGNPACTGHDEQTVFPPGGTGLCPTGIRTFARALSRVGDLNGVAVSSAPERLSLGLFLREVWAWIRAWQHAPMPRRIAFLQTLIDRPEVERRFQYRLFAFKCALMAALVLALVALGEAVGWKDLLEPL